MIPAPNLEAYVYCRALEEVGDVMVPGDALRTEELSIGAGDTYIVRYNVVADIVKSERAVLI